MFPTREIAVSISFVEESPTGATLSKAPNNLSEKGVKIVVSDYGDCGPSMEHSENEHIISPYPSCLAVVRKIVARRWPKMAHIVPDKRHVGS